MELKSELSCNCLDSYSGQNCENLVAKERVSATGEDSFSAGWVVAPIVFILLTLLAAAFYVVLRKRNYFGKPLGGGGGGGTSFSAGSVVSFRQGSNVEFGQQQSQIVSVLLSLINAETND